MKQGSFRGFVLALSLTAPAAAGELYFPAKEESRWERIEPARASWNQPALEAVMDFARSRRSTAVVILHKGRILAEKQWEPAKPAGGQYRWERSEDGQILEDVASVQKSVTAQLFGIARHKGLIDLDDPVSTYLGAGWSKTSPEQEKKITMRHLLTMTSGLTDGLEFQAAPGTAWRYNSVAYQKTIRAVAKAAGKSENQLTREWLTGPIGMRHSSWRERPGMGDMQGFVSSARDLARLGLLIEADGLWDGNAILPDRTYLHDSLQSSQKLNRAYGYLWWLNGKPTVNAAGARAAKLIPAAPDDLVAALGALGRKIYVVPSLGVVATRTGDNSDQKGEPRFDEEFWKLLMQAAPKK